MTFRKSSYTNILVMWHRIFDTVPYFISAECDRNEVKRLHVLLWNIIFSWASINWTASELSPLLLCISKSCQRKLSNEITFLVRQLRSVCQQRLYKRNIYIYIDIYLETKNFYSQALCGERAKWGEYVALRQSSRRMEKIT